MRGQLGKKVDTPHQLTGGIVEWRELFYKLRLTGVVITVHTHTHTQGVHVPSVCWSSRGG